MTEAMRERVKNTELAELLRKARYSVALMEVVLAYADKHEKKWDERAGRIVDRQKKDSNAALTSHSWGEDGVCTECGVSRVQLCQVLYNVMYVEERGVPRRRYSCPCTESAGTEVNETFVEVF